MTSFVYSNARIKAKEKSLLNSAQIGRLSDAASVEDALKLLLEFGYGSGEAVDNLNFDQLLKIEEKNVAAIIKELDVKDSGLSVFLTKKDFHNLKTLYKARETGALSKKDERLPLAADGNISSELLKVSVENGDYDNLPKIMAVALKKLDSLNENKKLTPHFIDATIDKAMFEDIFATLKKAKRKELLDYFVKSADVANISSFVRSKRLKLNFTFFKEGFIEGGELKLNFFEPLFELELEAFKEKLKYTKYSELYPHIGDSLSRFEAECDNALIEIFKKQKNDMFSVSPLAGFFLGKEVELKIVKLIVTGKQNNVDKEMIKDRMRELYA